MPAIIKIIWGLFGSTIVSLIINSGLPAAAEWLKKKGFSGRIIEAIIKIAKAVLGQLPAIAAEAHAEIINIKSDLSQDPAEIKAKVKAVKRKARKKAKAYCSGQDFCEVQK